MCVICGCSGSSSLSTAQTADKTKDAMAQPAGQHLHFGLNPAGVSVPGMSTERAIQLEQNVLSANNSIAQQNRVHFHDHGVLALNFVSSPGSGKTTLLCASLALLKQQHPEICLSVIEGDQQTSVDADRIRATGVEAVQVNTGKGCHLDAPMVAQAFGQLPVHDHGGILMIENVGNLVCPAMWDLGEAAKVAVLSVTEGEDKPLKYPDMFAAASVMLLNKVDLLPYVSFNVSQCLVNARRVNPHIQIIEVSATTGAGMASWLSWLLRHYQSVRDHTHDHGHDHDHHGHDHDHHGHGHPHGHSH